MFEFGDRVSVWHDSGKILAGFTSLFDGRLKDGDVGLFVNESIVRYKVMFPSGYSWNLPKDWVFEADYKPPKDEIAYFFIDFLTQQTFETRDMAVSAVKKVSEPKRTVVLHKLKDGKNIIEGVAYEGKFYTEGQ